MAHQCQSGIFYEYWIVDVIVDALCLTDLPYGWEKVDDPQYGTYYIE